MCNDVAIGNGRNIEKRLPDPGVLCTPIQPPCSRAMPSATASPSPVPSPGGLVVKNGSNTCSIVSGVMPSP